MSRRFLILYIFILGVLSVYPQNFKQDFDAFRQQALKGYTDFRDSVNHEYAEFLRKAWALFRANPVESVPKREEVPPVVCVTPQPVKGVPIPIEEEILTVPQIPLQPQPVSPVREVPMEKETWMEFSFYGTPMKVRFADTQRLGLRECTERHIADTWEIFSGKEYNNTIADCLSLRKRYQLGDWAYLQMLHKMSIACLGTGNEATLMMAYVFCQSGYKMRLGMSGGQLYMLFASSHIIYDMAGFSVNGEHFYALNGGKCSQMQICDAAFPKERTMSFWLYQAQLLANNRSEARTLVSQAYPEIALTVDVNLNLIEFLNDYPASMVDSNPMTRWAMYANMTLEEGVRNSLLPALQKKLDGLSKEEATERLLNWVQTAFVYEYDDKVWGHDRAFFAEETLYYPYCDCEDRSILFSRLVRDLLGLKVILVYYPGHLATAVCFPDEVKGDYIVLDGQCYVVCDPTYINASIGMTMSEMDNRKAKVILLE